jgi:hypothetical protein
MQDVLIGLADAIAELLRQALSVADDEAVRYKLGEVELEFNLKERRDGSAGAGVKFWGCRWRPGGSPHCSCATSARRDCVIPAMPACP